MDENALRILVVDDHRDTVDCLAVLLDLWGYEVKKAYDGRTGIVIAHDFEPDLVLLDIAMPDMDGYEVANQLRTHLPGSRMHMIALTGYGRTEDVRHAYEAGFDCHLLKPVDPPTLKTVLARYGMARATR